MIICHCGVVTDRAVVAAIDEGARTLAQVCQISGAGQKCGGCIYSVKQVLCQHGGAEDLSPLEASYEASQAAHSGIT
jgi:bacterioferritin-associated ferredoxin